MDAYTNCLTLNIELDEEDENDEELPLLECGQATNPEPPDNTVGELEEGDVFIANGIPVKVTHLISSSSPYSGEGLTSLPFSKKHISVSFSFVVVDSNQIMSDGHVDAARANPADYPNFSFPVDTISIGGDICVVNPTPPTEDEDGFDDVTGLNERGFTSDGFHTNGSLYDDSGFNINGIHQNGSKYDQWGCNVEKMDSLGQPCSPAITEIDI